MDEKVFVSAVPSPTNWVWERFCGDGLVYSTDRRQGLRHNRKGEPRSAGRGVYSDGPACGTG